MKLRQSPAVLLLGLGLLALAVLFRIVDPEPVARLRLSVFDAYQRLKPREHDPRSAVIIVEIDSASLERLGQWPWPRTRLAQLIDQLHAAGASAIAIDLILAEPDRLSPSSLAGLIADRPELAPLARELAHLPSNDEALAQAIAKAPVVLGFVGESGMGGEIAPTKARFASAGDAPGNFVPAFTAATASLPILVQPAAGIGSANWLPASDQIVRRVPLLVTVKDKLYPSLSLEAARVGLKETTLLVRSSGASGAGAFGYKTGIEGVRLGRRTLPTDANGEMWLHFAGYDPSHSIPAHQVLDGTFDRARIKDRMVLIGVSAPGLLDLRSTPLQGAVPGVAVHAEALEQILAGNPLWRPPYATGMEIIFLLLVGGALILLLQRAGPVLAAAAGVTAILVVGAASWAAFAGSGVLIDPVYPSLALVAIYLASSLSRYVKAEMERSFVRSAFSHYLAPALVEELASNPDKLKLGGETREVTVLFCDVRGFSGISEGLDAEALFRLVNEIFTPLTEAILEGGGNIDKFMGDAVMAVWNAPVAQPAHALLAARTSLAMLKALDELNAGRAARAAGDGEKAMPIRIGIGLNTGLGAAGNIGSPQRLNYSILSDAVNIASRLQDACKTYGLPIMAGEQTAEEASSLAFLEIDTAVLRGRARPERIFTLLGDEAVAASPDFQTLKAAITEVRAAVADGERSLAASRIEALKSAQWPTKWPSLVPLLDLYRARLN